MPKILREWLVTLAFAGIFLVPFQTLERSSADAAEAMGVEQQAKERVRLNEKAIAHIKRKFSQPARDHEAPRLSFIALADPQGNYDVTQRLLNQAMKGEPAFAVVLGDLTQRGTALEYERYVDWVTRNCGKAPIVSIIGNHDILNEGRSRYLSYFGRPDFYFDLPGARFICMDNSADKLAPRQIEWLKAVLEAAKGKRKFIFMHEPPYIGNWWFRAFTEGANDFLAAVEEHKVACVFAGHVHIYDKLARNGVTYIVAGSGGAPPANLPIGEPLTCYVKVEVSQRGVKTSVHRLALKESRAVKDASSYPRLTVQQD